MASEDRGRHRPSRKLTKKRRESRRVSLDIPERFKDGDDAQDDVTAPRRNNTMSMNQSMFSMIARAGQQSQTDLGAMREVDSGDSDDEAKQPVQYHSLDGAARLSRLSSAHDFRAHQDEDGDKKISHGKHRRILSDNKLLRSLPKLKIAGRKDATSDSRPTDLMSSSQFLPPKSPPDGPSATSSNDQSSANRSTVTPGEEIHVERRKTSDRKVKHGSTAALSKGKGPISLAKRLQQIFEFDDVEEVISGMSPITLRALVHTV